MQTSRSFKRPLLITLGLIIMLLLIVHFVVLNSYLSIKGIPSADSSVGYVDKQGKDHDAATLFGIYMVPRSSGVVTVNDGPRQTRAYVPKKALIGLTPVTVELRQQKTLTKIGADGLSCNGQTTERRYFTFDCFGATDTVFRYADKRNGEYENQVASTGLSNDRVAATTYTGGILSLVPLSESVVLEYTDITQQESRQFSLPYEPDDLIDIATGSGESFIVVNNTKHEVLYYPSLEGQRKKIAIEGDNVFSTCGVNKNKFSCASVHPKAEHPAEASHSADDEAEATSSKVVTYDVKDDSVRAMDLNDLVERICVTDDGVYILENRDILRYAPNATDPFAISSEVDSLSCDASTASYAKGSSVYVADASASHLALAIDRFAISSLQTISGRTVFSTFIKTDPLQTFHTYAVTDQDQAGDRLEESLPYTSEDIPIFDMDYDDSTIYIQPKVSVTSDRARGTTTIDQEQFSRTKREIEQRLSEDGLLEQMSILYY